mgnify:CR=1 FL=1
MVDYNGIIVVMKGLCYHFCSLLDMIWSQNDCEARHFQPFAMRVSIIKEQRTMRVKVTMACTECKQRNYNTMKNKKNNPDRLEMRKYCKFCGAHTLHKETR